ncbi:MAG: arginine--tRNA ligase [Candidatus Saccharibacteria bacterium]
MQDQINSLIKDALSELYQLDESIELDRPEEQFGDYSTNVALKLAAKLSKSPQDISNELAAKLKENPLFSEVNVAGPGFINLKLSNQALVDIALSQPSKSLEGKTVVAEYSDPNPFKLLHAGHLYTSIVGDSIANLMAAAGANVHRVNFGGDVGLHVAKNIWAMLGDLGGENPDNLAKINEDDRSTWLSSCYVKGTEAYENDETAKAEIRELNKRIYEITASSDHDAPLAKIYWTTRDWSYKYFEDFYARLGVKFEKYYPESEVSGLGVETVRQHIPDVYKESQGAIVFEGENHGLYTNVFINSEGLPTYAAKDVGLIMRKWQDYNYDKSVIITGNEQADYMRVVIKSVEQFAPEKVSGSVHLTHGLVKLPGGQKMSSRQGNVLLATDILDLAQEAIKSRDLNSDPRITVGAVKYAFLKQGMGGDIVYDANESVSIEGNSGPYLQYAYARAVSISNKAENSDDFDLKSVDTLTDYERSLVRKLGEYPEVINKAVNELKPHHVAGYLYDLAQTFNRFYENSRVIGDERQNLRLALLKLYVSKLGDGLKLLGIEPIDKV